MAHNTFGIDFGTNNLKIYNKNDDSILVEKNMIAIENKTTLFAYGDSAYDMYEKAPVNIQISNPVSGGVIADINNMKTILRYFITDMQKSKSKTADFLVAVPSDVTEVEKRAFFDLIKDANVKAKKIKVVEKAIADGIGLGIDVKTSQGVLIVNVGYETTEISILSLGGIVLSRLIKNGGLKFDDAIRNAIRKEFGLIVGGKTAESVKIDIREYEKEGKPALVYGRDIVTGLPMEKEVPVDLVVASMEEHYHTIVDSIKVILERTPPELGADIYRHGIYLTGGASQAKGLAEKIANGTRLKVNLAEDPINSVVHGLARILKDDKYKSVAYTIEGMGK